MYNPRKDFESTANDELGPFLKKHGFTRFKTRNFVRVTNDYILQIINFQKSAGFTYYINISSYPLAGVHSSFFGEGGLRIEELSSEKPTQPLFGKYSFGTEFMARENLRGILGYLNSSVMTWFDLTGLCQTFCDYEERSKSLDHGSLRPVLSSAGNEIFYAFILLQSEQYAAAKEYLIHLKEMMSQGKKYLEKNLDQINFLLTKLEQSDYDSIQATIKNNISTNLKNLALTKLKIYSVPHTTYDQFLAVQSVEFRGLEGMGPENYSLILNSDIDMFNAIKINLRQEFEVIDVSPVRFRIQFNSYASIHFVYNTADYIRKDNQQFSEYFKRKGIEHDYLSDQSSRIEYWADFSSDIPSRIVKNITKMLLTQFTTQIYMPGIDL